MSRPLVSSIDIVTTPGVASGPASGNDTFCSIRSADPSRNSRVDERSRSRSRAWSLAVAMSDGAGLSAGSASSGPSNAQRSPLSASIGRPRANPLSWPVQSIALNQSPESYEFLSSDLERSRSVPACQNDGVWASAVVASETVFIRTRSAIGVSVGSLRMPRSNRVSLSCASTYVMTSSGSSAYPAG